jgi:hypothetical protein
MSVEAETERPSIKDEAGPKFWYVMEKVIDKLPDNPKKSDIRRATRTMDHIAESFPCEDCVASYHEYKKEHPLDCHSKKECANYLCQFHNDIRRKQGKEVKDCGVNEEADCPNCKGHKGEHDEVDNEPANEKPSGQGVNMSSPEQIGAVKSLGDDGDFPSIDNETEVKLGSVVPGKVHTVPSIHHSVNVLKVSKSKSPNITTTNHKATSLDELKNVTRRIVEEMCRQHGAPMPELIFNSCPSNNKTSCTRVPVDLEGNMVKDVPTKLYFDPHSYSPRSIVHEVSHYIAKYNGDDTLFKDEVAIDTIARQVIDAGFTEVEAMPNERISLNEARPVQIATDMFAEGNWLAKGFKERADKRLSEWKRNFPTFSRLFSGPAADAPVAAPAVQVNTNPEPVVKAEPPPEVPQGTRYTDGFLSMIDPMFAPVANITGLHPRDVTDAHIPNLIGSAVTTLAESNLNDFGALLVSAGTAGLTLLLGVLAKDQMGMGDRRFMMGLGGNLLWNSLGYIANPKKSKNVFTHASMFGKAISIFDMPGMQHCVSYEATVTTAGLGPAMKGGVKNLSPEQIRGLQINQGFQPDVPLQNSYPLQGASTGGIGAPYGGRAVASADNRPYGGGVGGGVRPYGNLDSEFDEFSLEEQNRIGRAQRSAFSPAIA